MGFAFTAHGSRLTAHGSRKRQMPDQGNPIRQVSVVGLCVASPARIARLEGLALVAATAALGLPALRAVFFLRADEAQTTAMLADDARTLDTLGEPAEKLLEAFRLAEFNTHALTTTYLYDSTCHPRLHGGEGK